MVNTMANTGCTRPRKLIQTACPCHSHHARNGQADGADGKARKGRPEAGTGLCAQMRREDQIACTKKHGK